MSELTVTLSGDAATRLKRLVEIGAYESVEAAITEAISALEDMVSPDLEEWMRTIISQRYADRSV